MAKLRGMSVPKPASGGSGAERWGFECSFVGRACGVWAWDSALVGGGARTNSARAGATRLIAARMRQGARMGISMARGVTPCGANRSLSLEAKMGHVFRATFIMYKGGP